MSTCQNSAQLENNTLVIEAWAGESNGNIKCDMPVIEDDVFHYVDVTNKRPIDCLIEKVIGSTETTPKQVNFKKCSDGSRGPDWEEPNLKVRASTASLGHGRISRRRMASVFQVGVPVQSTDVVNTDFHYKFDDPLATSQRAQLKFDVDL